MEPALRQRLWFLWAAGVLLSLLPVASFIWQYVLSVQSDTASRFFRHFTVVYVDWVFVPFNFVVVRIIDWRRGVAIFLAAVMSVVLNIAGHAVWQYHGIDARHMISPAQVVLPSGWVHLGFSILQATLILAFIFARDPSAPFKTLATTLAIAYFLAAGVSGYVMNHGFIMTDVVMVASGMFLVIFYPRLADRQPDRVTGKELSKEA